MPGRRTLQTLLFSLVFCIASGSVAHAARIVVSCSALGKELEVCRSGAEAWARKTGNEVEILAGSSNAGERLGQLQLLLAAKSADIDVFLIDTTWPGILADFFLDLGADPEIKKRVGGYFPSFIRNNTVEGRLIALPWFIDAGLLYYRKDLLAKYGERPPETWSELTRIARKIQTAERRAGNPRMWGYVFQGRAYEGLTCNTLEWIHSSGGGTIVEPDGRVSVRTPGAARALELAASWIEEISPRGVLNYMEEEARGAFQAGNAVFLRNWPYVWKLANAADSPVRGKVGMTVLPRGEGAGSGHSSTLGGWSLAVSKYSRNPRQATSLVAYLAGPEEQRRRALVLGQHPTLTALYRDPALLQDNPELARLLRVFEEAVPRPSAATGPRYNRASAEIWEATHRILSREESVEEGLRQLESRLKFLSRGGKW